MTQEAAQTILFLLGLFFVALPRVEEVARVPEYDDNPPPQDAPAVEDGRFQWEENN